MVQRDALASDSTIAVLTAPTLASPADAPQALFQWTSVTGAQAYYLYVGTTPGAKDVVDSGELQTGSYLAQNLPYNQTLYATLWTCVGNLWSSNPSVFATQPQISEITTFTNGTTGVATTGSIQWSAAPEAQDYRFEIGSISGANDIYDSGPTQATSTSVQGLPPATLLFATLATMVNGNWYTHTSSFTTAPLLSSLTNPVDLEANVPVAGVFSWSSASDAQGYYLYVGSTPGAKDIVNSGELQTTSYAVQGLPYQQTLYATMLTNVGGTWYP